MQATTPHDVVNNKAPGAGQAVFNGLSVCTAGSNFVLTAKAPGPNPMTPLQVDRFIDRWYASAWIVSADADADDRPDRAQALKRALFKRRDLSRLSAVDATSFVLMKAAKISCAFSFDEHFQIAGFRSAG